MEDYFFIEFLGCSWAGLWLRLNWGVVGWAGLWWIELGLGWAVAGLV